MTVADQIAIAELALVELARSREGGWEPYALKIKAWQRGCSAGAMTLALNDLIRDGILIVGDDGLIRLCVAPDFPPD